MHQSLDVRVVNKTLNNAWTINRLLNDGNFQISFDDRLFCFWKNFLLVREENDVHIVLS